MLQIEKYSPLLCEIYAFQNIVAMLGGASPYKDHGRDLVILERFDFVNRDIYIRTVQRPPHWIKLSGRGSAKRTIARRNRTLYDKY